MREVVLELLLETLHLRANSDKSVANVGLTRLCDHLPLDTICVHFFLEHGFALDFVDRYLVNVRLVLHVAHDGVLRVLLLLFVHRVEVILSIGRLKDFFVFLLQARCLLRVRIRVTCQHYNV